MLDKINEKDKKLKQVAIPAATKLSIEQTIDKSIDAQNNG
jgi:hypothetical protein